MLPGRSFNDTSETERNYHLLRISASQSINSITDSVLHDMGVLDSKTPRCCNSSLSCWRR
jgi:hypothetical protein